MTDKTDYSDWPKEDLVKEIKKLKKRKKYGIVWDEEKTKEKFDKDSEDKLPILKEVKNKEIKTKGYSQKNILIEGENYHALSVLNYTHKGKIDMIYIDPPYNIGRGFRYNDKFIDSEDAYRHSKWLSFLKKRLILARNLLKQSGLIYISIDDNELAQLKLLCSEIFGEENFVSILTIVNNFQGRSDKKYIATTHEYMVVFRKSEQAEIYGLELTEERLGEYKNEDDVGRYRLAGLRKRGANSRRIDRPNLYYPIYVNPTDKTVSLKKSKVHTIEVFPKLSNGDDGNWRWGKSTAETRINELKANIVKGRNEWDILLKEYLYKKGEIRTRKLKSFLSDSSYSSDSGTSILRKIFAGKKVFDSPKSPWLLEDIIEYSTKSGDVILDFFAGSGTVAQSVLQLNQENNGQRKFILCTNNEGKICTDVCYPRISKIINGYTDSDNEKVKGLGGNLKYFKTDFVDGESTDKNKKKLVDQCTEMLCLKEDCFDELKQTKNYSIFKNHEGKYLGIIYDDDGIEPIKKQIKSTGKKFNVYVFSLDDSAREEEFEDVKGMVDLKPIPEVILNVYRRIFR